MMAVIRDGTICNSNNSLESHNQRDTSETSGRPGTWSEIRP